jgi:hypothetical protein
LNTGPVLELGGGQLANQGFVKPGGSANAGQTALAGDLGLELTSVLEIELGGTLLDEYDMLNVSGVASLGGALEVSLLDLARNPFSPAVGDVFDILSAETILNEFGSFSLPELAAGRDWALDYLIDEIGGTDLVRLRVVQVFLDGDLNGDGYVGSADLDIVRAHWGQTVPIGDLLMGDASGDGYVGSGDLDIVRANWGGSAAAVPEPGTTALLAVGLALVGMTLRRRGSDRSS